MGPNPSILVHSGCMVRKAAQRETNLNDESGYPHVSSGLVTSEEGQAVYGKAMSSPTFSQ